MKLREIAVAVAALSLAGAAVAAGNDTSSTTRGQAATNDAASQQSPSSNAGSQATNPSSSQMGSSSAAQSGNAANASSQGGMANEEHNPQVVRSAQQALKQQGLNVGAIDGKLGPETESALRQFQQSKGLPQSGDLDQQTLSALGVEQSGAQSPGGSSQGMSSQGASSQGNASQGAMGQGSAYK
jgi:hypothetical protein